MSTGRGGAPSRRGRSEDQPVRSSGEILTLRDESGVDTLPSCLIGAPGAGARRHADDSCHALDYRLAA